MFDSEDQTISTEVTLTGQGMVCIGSYAKKHGLPFDLALEVLALRGYQVHMERTYGMTFPAEALEKMTPAIARLGLFP